MTRTKLSPLELRILEALWTDGPLAIRDMVERFPAKKRPAYTTVQTVVYRLEEKGVVERTGKEGNAHVFAARISREEARARLVDEVLAFFGGRMQPLMAHLVEAGKLGEGDLEEAERLLREQKERGKKP